MTNENAEDVKAGKDKAVGLSLKIKPGASLVGLRRTLVNPQQPLPKADAADEPDTRKPPDVV